MAQMTDTNHLQPEKGLQMINSSVAESPDRVNSESADALMPPASATNDYTAESGLEATPEGASENPVAVVRVTAVPDGLTGKEAFAAFLSTLKPKGDGDEGGEIWLKPGHDRFIKAVWDQDGKISGYLTKKLTGDETSRVIYGQPFGFSKFEQICRTNVGGGFYIPTQPIGLPLAANVTSTDDLAVEIDQGTTEEQWALYQEFSEVTGLNWSALLTSGGKSIHGHIKAIDHLPLAQAQYLRRLIVIAMQSDPVTVRLHQPMRIPGFYRLDKESEQALLSYSLDRYSYDDLVAGLRKWFEFKNLPFPDRFTDKWWGQFHHTLKGCAKLDESKRLEQCRSLLVTGLEGFESELAQVAAEQQKRREVAAAKRDAADNGDGTPSASEQVVSASERLGDAAFDWPRHSWIGDGDKYRGDCPFHESASGTSAWIAPLSDGGGWGFHCTACTDDKPIDAFKYRRYLEKGWGAKYPKGKPYIEAVQSFLSHYGFPFEEQKPQPSKKFLAEKEAALSRESAWKVPVVQNYTIGKMVWKGRGEDAYQEFEPLLDCDFTIEKIFKSTDGGGILLEVKHWVGKNLMTHQVLIDSIDCLKADKFAEALTRGLGSQISCTLQLSELQALLHNRKQDYYLAGKEIGRMADRFGEQTDGFRVFENCQFTPTGEPCTEAESGWIFNPRLGHEDGLNSPVILPENPEALPKLVAAAKAFYHPNALGYALCELGYGVATLHRKAVIQVYDEFAQSTIDGEAGCGKTKAAKMAASVAGMHKREFIMGVDTTASASAERLKLYSSLPVVYDDPIPLGGDAKDIKAAKKIVNATLSRLFNGRDRDKRGGGQAANTNVIVTSNAGANGAAAALDERIIIKNYPNHPANLLNGEGDRLDRAMDKASGGYGALIRIKFDRDKIDSYVIALLKYLPNAHVRQARSLAIQCYFTEEFCKVAGVADFDAFAFTRDVLCPQADATETAKPNLTDFLERLDNLRTVECVGRWNATMVTRDGKSYLAIKHTDVWEILQKQQASNTQNYGLSAIKAQIIDQGGFTDSKQRQKFVPTKQGWIDYLKASNQFNMFDSGYSAANRPKPPKKEGPYACWLIPANVVEEVLGRPWDDTDSSEVCDPLETEPTPSATPETTETTFTPIETEEIENCLTIAETAAAASPEAVSTAWQMLRQLPNERLKRAVWHRLSVAARNAMQKANESDRLGIWERVA
jgi:hypothetical protein